MTSVAPHPHPEDGGQSADSQADNSRSESVSVKGSRSSHGLEQPDTIAQLFSVDKGASTSQSGDNKDGGMELQKQDPSTNDRKEIYKYTEREDDDTASKDDPNSSKHTEEDIISQGPDNKQDKASDDVRASTSGSDKKREKVLKQLYDKFINTAEKQGKSTDDRTQTKTVDDNYHPYSEKRRQPTEEQVERAHRHYVEKIERELKTVPENQQELKETLSQAKLELEFTIENFDQRVCTRFCPADSNRENSNCKCGLPKDEHLHNVGYREELISDEWSIENTETVPSLDFGWVIIRDKKGLATRSKYIRVDDRMDNVEPLFTLLTEHWCLPEPQLALSVTGGDATAMTEGNPELFKLFTQSLVETTFNSKTWVITHGLCLNAEAENRKSLSSKAALHMLFSDELPVTEWNGIWCRDDIHMIGIAPWGAVANNTSLHGGHVVYSAWYEQEFKIKTKHSLQQNQDVFLLCDDGTCGPYIKEPSLRWELEKNLEWTVPFAIVVLGGDQFTVAKVAEALENDMLVTIVKGSGEIADMLAYFVIQIREVIQWIELNEEANREDGEKKLQQLKDNYGKMSESYTVTEDIRDKLGKIMVQSDKVTVFGTDAGCATDLVKTDNLKHQKVEFAMLQNITVRAEETLQLAMAENENEGKQLALEFALRALKLKKAAFVKLLVDPESEVQADFQDCPIISWLHQLYRISFSVVSPVSKVLTNLAGIKQEDFFSSTRISDATLLPYVGKIIYKLLGNNYRIIYQEEEFTTKGEDRKLMTMNNVAQLL